MRIQSLLSGGVSCLPGGNQWLFRRYKARATSAGTSNARYCYSVWLRHLVMAGEHGAVEGVPKMVAELGPGNSLGTGLAALLSGVGQYYAFDLVDHTATIGQVKIFDRLVDMFHRREPIPDSSEFPQIRTELESYRFPSHILSDSTLARALHPKRIAGIRAELMGTSAARSRPFISYVAPWNDIHVIEEGTIDMMLSMSVLEHVDDLEWTYQAASRWLKSGGCMSHEIDFGSHGHAAAWNGHWACPEGMWRMIRGRRPYLINREPYSRHVNLVEGNNFRIVANIRKSEKSGIRRHQLVGRFRDLTDVDLETRNAFILSIKA